MKQIPKDQQVIAMPDQGSYSTETIDGTLVVQFTQSSLVFPEQLRSMESDLKSPSDELQHRPVVFDFTGVGHISSFVWGELVRLNKMLRESGRRLRLCNLSEHLREALDAMKLDQILAVFATREDALANLHR